MDNDRWMWDLAAAVSIVSCVGIGITIGFVLGKWVF